MFGIKKEWKESNVSLEVLEKHMREEYPSYVGNQAAASLELYFSEEPSEEEKEAIDAFWEELDDSSYVSAEAIKNKIEELKASAATKSWDELSVAQRKLILGQTPTTEELGL